MKIWGFCDQTIPQSIGTNFGYCFWDYYIFPGIIAIIIAVLFIIIKSKFTNHDKCVEKTKRRKTTSRRIMK